MGEFSIFHWLIVLAIVLIFFGGRRIPEVMSGLGEGIRSFKDGMSQSATRKEITPRGRFIVRRTSLGGPCGRPCFFAQQHRLSLRYASRQPSSRRMRSSRGSGNPTTLKWQPSTRVTNRPPQP